MSGRDRCHYCCGVAVEKAWGLNSSAPKPNRTLKLPLRTGRFVPREGGAFANKTTPGPTMKRARLVRLSSVSLAGVAGLYACSENPVETPAAASGLAPRAAVVPPPSASLTVKVQVPASMRSSPFNVDRFLTIPPNFNISVFARIGGARFLAVAPNGDLLVSRPGAGSITLVRPGVNGADPTYFTWASGLYRPHDIVFHTLNGTTYVYVAEADKIARYVYSSGGTTGQGRQVIISGLPTE